MAEWHISVFLSLGQQYFWTNVHLQGDWGDQVPEPLACVLS